MKLRYIIATLAAVAALFTGCKEEGDTYLNEIKVSSSYVGIPMEGGEKDIKVNATEAWEFVAESIPEWLTVAPLSGAAGESSVKFSADESFRSPAQAASRGSTSSRVFPESPRRPSSR